MTGAGFGGCAIALVKTDAIPLFTQGLETYYKKRVGYLPSVYSSFIGRGVHEIH
jgi:galactokinase